MAMAMTTTDHGRRRAVSCECELERSGPHDGCVRTQEPGDGDGAFMRFRFGGGAAFTPYGIQKLKIMCFIEDEKVSIDLLQ
ncbi:GL18570 [Drosophila persimilis]|uniref:GL18570 n=1 Tax=Drosophila persimilis TaxID=7234 RepID=B4G6N6_DROPE|nr:GL18570 [Drosophila persimilis]